MKKLRVMLFRAAGLFRRQQRDVELAEEIESNLQLHIADNLRDGMNHEEARREALIRLGGIQQTKEAWREARGFPLCENLLQDLRFAVRTLCKSPGFTFFAGTALALGIAATTAVFSIADAVLLRSFSYRDPGHLVMLWEDDTAYGFPRNNASPFSFVQWKERNHELEDMAALTYDSLNLTGNGAPEYLHTNTVTPNFFSVLGVSAAHGRTFISADGRPGSPLTAVLSFGLWTRRFGADPRIIGQDLLLNGTKYTVVGIMPRDFRFLDSTIDLWVPSQWTAQFIQDRKSDHFLSVVGRLKTGFTVDAAQKQMISLGKQLADENIRDATAVLVPLREQVSGDVRPAILMLLGAVAFLLLIACANVANLLLARGSARHRELAIRLALGATRRRLIGQMLVESLVLSSIAGAAGMVLAFRGTPLLKLLLPDGVTGSPTVDVRLLAFTAVVSLATGVLFGIVPAIRASRTDVLAPLKQSGTQTGEAGGQRLRHVLVVAEIALTMVLLSGAALMLRSFQNLYHQDPGFRADHLLTLQTSLPRPKYADFARRSHFYREVVQRVETLPGVLAAGYVTALPLANQGGGSLVQVENRPFDPEHMLIANVRVVTPDYFRAVGMTLRQGRLLDRTDGVDAPKVVVINQSMARAYWPGKDPLGRRFKRGLPQSDAPWWTVVGVVGDMRQGGMNVPVRPEAYFPFEQADFFAPDSLAVRTSGDPLSLAEDVRQQVWAVDKDQPVSNVAPLTQLVDSSIAQPRLNALLLGGFAAMALLLAALGIYAVLSFAVMLRTREIGVRVALGARRGEVLRMVLLRGARLFGMGAAIGFAAAFFLSRLLGHLLFEVRPGDPLSYVMVMAIFAVVALIACYVPALRAARVDPVVALRYE